MVLWLADKWLARSHRWALFAMALSLTSLTSLSAIAQPSAAIESNDCEVQNPPLTDDQLSAVQTMPLEQQVSWLDTAVRSKILLRASNDQLITLFRSFGPSTISTYVAREAVHYQESEFQLVRQERIDGHWPSHAEHMFVRYQQTPRRVYIKWLAGGAHAGQEVLYDEQRDPTSMLGHLGGVMAFLSLHASIDGPFARSQSNHSVRDIGLPYIAELLQTESAKLNALPQKVMPQIAVECVDKARIVDLTWITPSGRPTYYAKKEVLGISLVEPWLHAAAAYDNEGDPFERFTFENMVARHFPTDAFEPNNAEYRFGKKSTSLAGTSSN